jgi:hypothetical protein
MKALSIILFSLMSCVMFFQNASGDLRSSNKRVSRPVVPLQVHLFVKKTPSSEAGWFTSIKDALDHAVKNKYRMIKVTVYPGTYTERLQISRPTKIEGHRDGAVTISGSISNGKGHSLNLFKVNMRNCRPYSLIQRGGSLTLTDFGIHNTRRTGSDSHSGVAIDIGGGVVGRFTNVTLNDNKGLALLMHGSGTKVLAFRLTVMNNQINRRIIESAHSSSEWTQRISAVEVANGAMLLAANPVIENNEFIGLLVRDGGKAHIRAGRVTNTKSITYELENGSKWGGTNVSARNRSRLELRNMQISGAELVGIQNSISWVKASDSHVIRNVIGAHVRGRVEPDYDPWECLCNYRTIYRDNTRDFDSSYMPVPETGFEEETPNCPGVQWNF